MAASMGHANPAVFETVRGRFVVTCSCGYQSTTRRTFVDALEAGVHHALKEVAAQLRNGVSVPGNVGGRR